MHLLIDQIVYTSLDNIGFESLTSSQVPQKIHQAFIQRIVATYWDIYNPPPSGYQAIYLHQLTSEQTLFGWLYSEGRDDLDRSSVPYFHCYYLAEPLRDFHLENIFTCLQKGPVSLIDRNCPPATLEPIVIQTPWTFNNKFWSYQSSRPGLEVPIDVRDRSYIDLRQGKLLDIFIPIAAPQIKTQLKSPTSLEYLVETIETSAVVLDQDPQVIAPVAITPYREHNENLQRYQQALIEALTKNYLIGDRTRNLKRLQQFLRLTNEDIAPIEAEIHRQTQAVQHSENYPRAIGQKNLISTQVIKEIPGNKTNHHSHLKTVFPQIVSSLQNFNTTLEQSTHHNFVLAYKNSQLLLGLGIFASSLALLGSIYGLLRTSIIEQSQPELAPSTNSSVSSKTSTEVFNVSQLRFNYREPTAFALSKDSVLPVEQDQSKFKLSLVNSTTTTGFNPKLKISLADKVSFARYWQPNT